MSQHDYIFINQILKSSDNTWQQLNVLPEMIDSDVRAVYNFIINHFSRFGKLPSRREVKHHFPTFQFIKPKEPIEYYAENIKTNYVAAKLRQVLSDTSEAYKGNDLKKAFKIFQEGAEGLLKTVTTVPPLNYCDALKDVLHDLDNYEFLNADFSFGDPVLDSDLVGMERGDWVLIAGTAAAGKTWLLLKLVHNLVFKEKLNVLFLSCELSNKVILRRLHSISAGIPYPRFRRGQITDDERKKLMELSQQRFSSRLDIISAVNHNAEEGKLGSLNSIRLKLRQYKPDVLAVDGLYLGMEMDKWGDAVNFANNFHMLLQETKIPAITTSQLRNVADASKPALRDLAFTAAFQQATDFVFLMSKDEKMRREHYSILKIGKAREDMDCQLYYLRFNPGAEIRLERVDKQVNNPLLED